MIAEGTIVWLRRARPKNGNWYVSQPIRLAKICMPTPGSGARGHASYRSSDGAHHFCKKRNLVCPRITRPRPALSYRLLLGFDSPEAAARTKHQGLR